MGGIAIKKVIGREGDRFTPQEKKLYCDTIKFLGYDVIFPVEVQSKESFGDIDVLLNSNENVEEFIQSVVEAFSKKGIEYQGKTVNGKVHSLSIGNKQIDIVITSKDDMLISFYYYSNNDLGNLLGRIARSLGFKFGHDGLHAIVRSESDHILGEFLITKDFSKILHILGFSQEDIDSPYLDCGFPDFVTMYEWVTRSLHFNGTKYDLSELNQINRIRNKKRKTYMDFVEWLQTSNMREKKPDFPMNQKIYLYYAIQHCNRFVEYICFLQDIELKKYANELFNGNLIMEWFGLTGKKLGEFIAEFKKLHPMYITYHNTRIREESERLFKEKYNH